MNRPTPEEMARAMAAVLRDSCGDAWVETWEAFVALTEHLYDQKTAREVGALLEKEMEK